jgi:hypothetical protein
LAQHSQTSGIAWVATIGEADGKNALQVLDNLADRSIINAGFFSGKPLLDQDFSYRKIPPSRAQFP